MNPAQTGTLDEGDAASDERCRDVCAVVVTFNPEPESLRQLILALRAQVGWIFVVDNASTNDVSVAFPPESVINVELVRNRQNLGIAAAQNQGALQALAREDCRFVLLSDQDSLPGPNMVRRLRQALEEYGGDGLDAAPDASRRQFGESRGPVAAAGPWSIDLRSGERAALVADAKFWQAGSLHRPPSATPSAPSESPFEVGFLISSGSLIPAAVLRRLGGMRSNYFIEHVDTEWCLRARAAGYRLIVVPGAGLGHRLGDVVRRIWFFGFHRIAQHAPLRNYYMFRNTFLMSHDLRLPLPWRLRLLFRLVPFAGFFLLMGDQRLARFRLMGLGLAHGLRSRGGRLQPYGTALDVINPTDLDPPPSFSPSLIGDSSGARTAKPPTA